MTHEMKTVPHPPHDLADSPSTIGPPSDQPPCASTRFSRSDQSQPHSHDNANVLVTVLMPCLNEARTLAACIQQAHAGCQAALAQRAHAPGNMSVPGSTDEDVPDSNDASGAAHGLTYEILIADNGSTDGSPEIAMANDARVVHVEQKGYGAALLGGIEAARGKYIIMGDSDCSYDFGEVPRFLDKLEEGYDLVMGNRFAGGIMPGAMPWHHRYIGNPLLSGLGRLLYRTPCRDWHCGLRAFDREKIHALNLKAPGMEFASEIVIRASQKAMQICEIPVVLYRDERDRAPHLRSFYDAVRHFCLLVRFRNRALSAMIALTILALLTVFYQPYAQPDKSFQSSLRASKWKSVQHVQLKSFLEGGTEPQIARVRIENPFGIPLKIRSIELGCVCLSANLESEILNPEGGDLTIKMKPTGSPGPFGQRITLNFLDHLEKEWVTNIFLEGYITPRVEMIPDLINFGEIAIRRQPSQHRKLVALVPNVEGNVALVSQSGRIHVNKIDIDTLTPIEQMEMKEQLQKNSTATSSSVVLFEILLSLSAENSAGPYRDELRLSFDGNFSHGMTLPVVYNLRSMVKVEPQRIVFPNVKRGVQYESVISIAKMYNLNLPNPTVTFRTPQEQLRCEVIPVNEGYHLKLSFKPDGENRYWTDRVDVDFGEFVVSIPMVAEIDLDE